MIRLVFAYLLQRRLTTALNIVLLTIAVGMVVLLLQVSRQAEQRFLDGVEGIDLVVGAKGSPLQLVLSSVYHLDQPTGNIPVAALHQLRSNPLVASAVPLALGDQFRGFRIVGTEPSFLAHYRAAIPQGRVFAEPLEVVIGAQVARQTGAGIGQRFVGSHGLADADGHEHEQSPFEVVGILAPTGKPIDRLIVTSVASVWQVHGLSYAEQETPEHPGEEAHEHHAGEGHGQHTADEQDLDNLEITAILVRYRTPLAAVRLPEAINRNTVMQAASPARESTRLITLFEPAIAGLGYLALLLGLTGALAIFVALWNAVHSRRGDLALLRVLGAGRPTIFGTVLLEGTITAGIAGVLGIGFAHAVLWLGASAFRGLDDAGIAAGRIMPEEAAILGGAVVLGALAALLPAWTVLRSNLASVLNRT